VLGFLEASGDVLSINKPPPREQNPSIIIIIPTLAALPRLHSSPLAKCGCKKFCMDFHGDHTSTCTSHSGATKAHDWMVSVLGPLFRTAGHLVRTQHGVTASAGQRRGDVEVRSFLRDQAGSRSLVFDLSITHDRFGSSSHVQQNGSLSHPQDLERPDACCCAT
jgi:hypothetical protein